MQLYIDGVLIINRNTNLPFRWILHHGDLDMSRKWSISTVLDQLSPFFQWPTAPSVVQHRQYLVTFTTPGIYSHTIVTYSTLLHIYNIPATAIFIV